uniref:Uncharacterized protein n=1 Tax=Maylandia zebra TaxID=106582 RepID=A0A3P9D9A0_9CICH
NRILKSSLESQNANGFYEVTLLNTQKSSKQKLEELNHMADKWEKSLSLTQKDQLQKKSVVEVFH